jgi:hypothetical protein
VATDEIDVFAQFTNASLACHSENPPAGVAVATFPAIVTTAAPAMPLLGNIQRFTL